MNLREGDGTPFASPRGMLQAMVECGERWAARPLGDGIPNTREIR